MKAAYAGWRAGLQSVVAVALALAMLAGLAHAGTGRMPEAGARTRTVLVLGDSLSAGYGMAASNGWVALIDRRLEDARQGWDVINASVSGDTTAGGVSRLQRQLQRTRPGVVVIALGANDGLRGLPPDRMRANLTTLVRQARASGARVLLVGMRMPPNLGRVYTDAFEATYRQVAKQEGVPLLPFLLEPVAGDRRSFQADNLHPTKAAQPKIAEHVWPALAPLLK